MVQERCVRSVPRSRISCQGSPYHRQYFESKQREVCDSYIYQFVANGGLRWNSDLKMIERALKLRDVLQLYQDYYTKDEADPLE